MTTEILRLHRNEKGRDFVVGDIHGCFGQLDVELQRVGFDPARDRCLSVGDLVDRGPDSFAALEWIGRPWFHACLGNHDDMVLNASADPADLAWWVMRNEGGWWLDLDQATQDRFIEGFGRLPLAIEVETAHGRVGIVHADVPAGMGWDAFVAALAAGDARVRETALWGRSRATGAVRTPVAGIDRVVCGHTIAEDRRVHVVGNVWLIDTGAFLAPQGRLTLLDVDALFDAG